MADSDFYLEIPDPPPDAPYGQIMAHAALVSLMFHVGAFRRTSSTKLESKKRLPKVVTRAMKAYLRRWSPR